MNTPTHNPLISLIARTATREELIELLRQHDAALVAERAQTDALAAALRDLARQAHGADAQAVEVLANLARHREINP